MHLTFSEIAGTRVGLTTAEAVALVLAAAREFDCSAASGTAAALPPANQILLTNTGRVSFLTAVDSPGRDRVAVAGALLRRLLGVDDDARTNRPQAPGALLLLLARAAGEIDLPPLSYPAFLRALSRFGSPDESTFASVYDRCVDHVVGIHNATAPERGRVATLAAERRVNGLPASDLRRELRGAELESFAARRRNVGREVSASGLAPSRIAMAGRAVAASVLLAAALWMAPALDRQSATWMHAAAPRAAANSVDRELPPVAVQRPLVTVAPAPSELSTAGETVDNPSPGSVAQHQNIRGVDTSVSAAPLISSSVVGRDIFSPSFADDGQEVLVHAGRTGAALMRASFDGSGHAAVATLLQDGAANHHGTVSPDGARLAYDSDRDGTRAVYVARADASHPEKISGTGYAAVPRWSPDGRRLAFIRAELNRPRVWNVWVADLESHTLSRVSHHKVGQAWGGSWFPDGHRIAYSVEDTLVIADLKGGTSRVLHAPRRGQLIRTPAVSPDGKWIVFQVHGDGVWLLDVATMAMRRVLGDAAAEEFAWSPDSTRVAYHTMRQHAWSLWQLELRPAAAG